MPRDGFLCPANTTRGDLLDLIALSFGSSLTKNLATSALPGAPTVDDELVPRRAGAGRAGVRRLLGALALAGRLRRT